METSILIWEIAHDSLLQQRIEALGRADLWSGDGNPEAYLPVDQVAWAIAADEDLRGAVIEAAGDNGTISDGCAALTDSDIAPVVTSSLNRLRQLADATST